MCSLIVITLTTTSTTSTTIATHLHSRLPEFVILRSPLPATVLSGITAPRAFDLGGGWMDSGEPKPSIRSGEIRSGQPRSAKPGPVCSANAKAAAAIGFGTMPLSDGCVNSHPQIGH